jgi:hypothetical protein
MNTHQVHSVHLIKLGPSSAAYRPDPKVVNSSAFPRPYIWNKINIGEDVWDFKTFVRLSLLPDKTDLLVFRLFNGISCAFTAKG